MADDILNQIDDVLERNRQRFDPFGPSWDEDRVEQWDDAMRVRPARAGIEEVSEPVEAAPELTVLYEFLEPPPMPHLTTLPVDRTHLAITTAYDPLTVGPSGAAEPSRLDIRRRVQDGSAPVPAAHDHVAEALRAEVLRQGLTECEIDGVRWIYGGGQWSESPYQPEPDASDVEPGGYRACMERLAPPVDELVEPLPAPVPAPCWKPWRW